MPRKAKVKTREISPDPIYKSRIMAKFINCSMKGGKKSVAQKQVYRALEIVKDKVKKDPLKVFLEALGRVKPSMEVRSRRVGGAAYQVPVSVRGARKDALAIRWIIDAARGRSNSEYHSFAEKLAAELIEASKGEGSAVKKKLDTERMAEANRAFAHFRW